MGEASFRNKAIKCFRKHCEDVGILPYIVPAGGFMVTPLFDIDVGTLYLIGQKLEIVVIRTAEEIGWANRLENKDVQKDGKRSQIHPDSKCQNYLHQTKSCTSCSSFVCPNVRMRFVK